MPADWQFLVLDSKDAQQVFSSYTGGNVWTYGVVDRLPLLGASMSWGISGQPGTLTGGLDAYSPEAFFLDPPRHLLIAERNQIPRWGGIIWSTAQEVGENLIGVSADEYWTYFQRRCELRMTVDYSAAAVEQFGMVTDMLSRATTQQAAATGTLKIHWKPMNTGVAQFGPKIAATDNQKVGSLVEQQCALENGMEFQVKPLRINDRYAFVIDFGFPRLGRKTPYVLNYGSSISSLGWKRDGGRLVNDWDSVGQPARGKSGVPPSAHAVSAQSKQQYPTLMGSDTIETSIPSRIQADANFQLGLHRFSSQLSALQLTPDREDTDIDLFALGDTIRAVAQKGALDMDADLRIGSMSMALTDLGDISNPAQKAEVLTLDIAQDATNG